MSLALSGCAAATDSDGTSDNTLIIAMTASDIPGLDTAFAQTQGFEGLRFVADQLYDGLTRFDLSQGDESPEIVPGLAVSWEPNEDLSSWTFTLRPDVTFHDGTPWNADAAIFNLERYVDTGSENFYPELSAISYIHTNGITGFSKVDDMTIQIDTGTPMSFLPRNLATVYFASPTAVEELGNEGFAEAPVGTGPFRFESLERGLQLTMVANEDYWKGSPLLDTLVLRPISDPTARVAALRAGEVNWIEAPSPDEVAALGASGFQVVSNSYDHMWSWILDTTKAPFNDPRVREALNYAIDRDSLAENILQGTGESANGFVPRANFAYDEDRHEVFSYDPDRAVELLAEAGFADGLTFRLSYPTSGSGNMIPGPMNIALQADLAKVGVTVELEPIEWATMLSDFNVGQIPGDAEAMNISLSYVQEAFWYGNFGTGGASNVGGYSNPEYDALLEAARLTLDQDERAELYAQAGEILGEDAPWLIVVNDLNTRIMAADVEGFVQPQSWFIDLTTVSVG